MKGCRHGSNSWIIGGSSPSEWCYVCGAYRGLRYNGPSSVTPRTRWIKPTGDPENNPYEQTKRHLRRARR